MNLQDRNLSQGINGDDVKLLQSELRQLGYDRGHRGYEESFWRIFNGNVGSFRGLSSMTNEDNNKNAENIRTAYNQLCASYNAIDDFRAKLLGLLPTGTGIFLIIPELLKGGTPRELGPSQPELIQTLSLPIGAFGFVIALGLFAYELYGIRKCTYLIEVGKSLERKLGITGQFENRAPGIGGLINEPFASGIIYPAVLAAWTFLALNTSRPDAKSWAAFVFILFIAISGFFIWWLRRDCQQLKGQLTAIQLSDS